MKLGVEARFETGLSGVPSFSSSFSGNETMVGGELFGIIKLPNSKYAAETGIGCRCHRYVLYIAPPEGEMPKIKGPFWVVLVFVYSKGAVVRT